jgi:hypothetical protein
LLRSLPPLILARWDAVKACLRRLLINLSRWRSSRTPRDEAQSAHTQRYKRNSPPAAATTAVLRIRVRQVQDANFIPELKTANGTVSDPDGILAEASGFYVDLFSQRPTSRQAQRTLLGYFTPEPLPPADRDCLDAPFTPEELWEAARRAPCHKSPGPDGLPAKTYLHPEIWETIAPLLVATANYALQTGSFAASQSCGHLRLLHKAGERSQLGNWHPLTLLNADLKVITRALNTLLTSVLPRLVHPDQTGFIPGRRVDENIATVQTIFSSPAAKGYLAAIDFVKAYDRVDYAYLRRCLEACGLGAAFIATAMASISNLSISMAINGWLSRPFLRASGVCQGNPLSPSLFAIAMEPLACTLRAHLRGIPLYTSRVRALLFADDLVFAACGAPDLARGLRDVAVYEEASGAKLSPSKSFLFPVRHPSISPDVRAVLPSGFGSRTGSFRHLGVQVGPDVQADEVWSS